MNTDSKLEYEKEISLGGIYWQCTACNLTGVITHNAPVCKLIRDEMGLPAPAPCAIEFDDCAQHGIENDATTVA